MARDFQLSRRRSRRPACALPWTNTLPRASDAARFWRGHAMWSSYTGMSAWWRCRWDSAIDCNAGSTKMRTPADRTFFRMDGGGSRGGAGRGQLRGSEIVGHWPHFANRARPTRQWRTSRHDGLGLSRWQDVSRCGLHLHPRQNPLAVSDGARSHARGIRAMHPVHGEIS